MQLRKCARPRRAQSSWNLNVSGQELSSLRRQILRSAGTLRIQCPEIVSLGGQKNFKKFMEALDDQVRRPTLDEAEYKRIVGRAILFRDVTKVVNSIKDRIPAYRANVVAYLVSYLSFRMTDGIDFDRIWEKQATPEAVKDVLRASGRTYLQSHHENRGRSQCQ